MANFRPPPTRKYNFFRKYKAYKHHQMFSNVLRDFELFRNLPGELSYFHDQKLGEDDAMPAGQYIRVLGEGSRYRGIYKW